METNSFKQYSHLVLSLETMKHFVINKFCYFFFTSAELKINTYSLATVGLPHQLLIKKSFLQRMK